MLKHPVYNFESSKVKCVYKYPVKWMVKINGVHPLTHNGWHFDFVQDEDKQCITHIIISVPLTPSDKLPTYTPNPENSRVIDFAINEPASAESLTRTLRTLEGFLSIYGLERIALDELDISWVAETEEEKIQEQRLNLKYTKRETATIAAPFSVVERSIIAATQALDWEVPLSFYRKGNNDYHERRYIDAIHDYYFLIETLFGNGKTKNYQVKEELKKSQQLVKVASQVLQEGERTILNRGTRTTILSEFRQKIAAKTPEEYLEHVVDLRGFLHHHSLQHKKIWNPSLEYEYELDAILLSYLSFLICSQKVESMICAPNN